MTIEEGIDRTSWHIVAQVCLVTPYEPPNKSVLQESNIIRISLISTVAVVSPYR